MQSLVLGLKDMDNAPLLLVGGKGLNLGKLSRMEGIHVPEGFCVTTEGYQEAIRHNEAYHALLERLTVMQAKDHDPAQLLDISRAIRQTIEASEIPAGVVAAVTEQLSRFGEDQAYAVRSSATAEDLPQASFAGQQDTFLNIVGLDAILEHIRKCWASLFTDRAVSYRMQQGYDHSQVYLSVIVQKMVFPQASGILFTADPVTNNRKLLSIDAGYGLGEALVSGIVSADVYKVRDERIVEQRIASKSSQSTPCRKAVQKSVRLIPFSRKRRHLRNRKLCSSPGSGGRLRPASGFRRISNGASLMIPSISSRAGRLQLYIPSLIPVIRRTARISRSATGR